MPIGKRNRAGVRSTGCGLSTLLTTVAVAIGLACVAIASPLAAQSSVRVDVARANLDRQALEGLQQRYEAAAASPAYSEVLRQRAQLEAAKIRVRLEQGDFNVGDRIALTVQGNDDFSDTFTVQPGRVLVIPTVGEIPLAGVLSTELQGHLISYISGLLRDPQVQAKALIRVAITDGVAQPGFYVFPTDALLADAIMQAGGPVADAKMSEIRVERGTERIWEPAPLRAAVANGSTLEQLDLRGGDRVVVPRGGNRSTLNSIQQGLGFTAFVLSLPFMVLGMTRIF